VLVDPGRTPYDLNFRLFGIPVRVHPMFWLIAGLFGADLLNGGEYNIANWLAWIAAVFVSVLVHELGHAFAFRLFGRRASIVLYAFGGLAQSATPVSGRFRRILVSLAGPFAQFLLAGLLFGVYFVSNLNLIDYHPVVVIFILELFIVSIVWGIFNLIPVFPLDGGQICKELCEAHSPQRGFRRAIQISVWAAFTLSVYSFVCYFEATSHKAVLLAHLPNWFPRGTLYTGLLFLVLAYQNYLLLQQIGRSSFYYEDDRLPWEK
jgi:Zn-dependent protease